MENKLYVQLKNLPNLSELNKKVREILVVSSWWEMYGVDWSVIAVAGVLGLPLAFFLLASENWLPFFGGMLLLGCVHSTLGNKAGHSALHGAVSASSQWNKFWAIFFIEFYGTFSEVCGNDMHLKVHHPYTNIIGLGDSSVWRAPMVPCLLYMFVTPLLMPILTPMVVMKELYQRPRPLLRFLVLAGLGLAFHVYVLVQYCGFTSAVRALICVLISRSFLGLPFIHINIFQHIGLTIYSQEHRPVRIYQMATGVLNITRNIFLDICFGHALVNCHVEHHLFPNLSDNMCLKIKPVVREFLVKNGLPYHEDSYWGRVKLFVKEYKSLMVHAPPITHFVGIQ